MGHDPDPIEVRRYFVPVLRVFGEEIVNSSEFLTTEFWSTQYENDRVLQCTVEIRCTITEDEIQQSFPWLDSDLQGEREVKPGIFFGNADNDWSDEVFLRTADTRIKGCVTSQDNYTIVDFETPPELFTVALWNTHKEWFKAHSSFYE